MYEAQDRLPDEFWTTEELYEMKVKVLEPSKYDKAPVNICVYHLWKGGRDTGLAMITAVESVIDGQEAIDYLWSEVGITAIIGEYSEELTLWNNQKIEALYVVLEKYWYEGNMKLPGSDKVYKWQNWMADLIS